jgi:hypothetical protein
MPALPNFNVVRADRGYAIEAVWPDGQVERLSGLFVSADDAERWLESGGGQLWFAQRFPSSPTSR